MSSLCQTVEISEGFSNATVTVVLTNRQPVPAGNKVNEQKKTFLYTCDTFYSSLLIHHICVLDILILYTNL